MAISEYPRKMILLKYLWCVLFLLTINGDFTFSLNCKDCAKVKNEWCTSASGLNFISCEGKEKEKTLAYNESPINIIDLSKIIGDLNMLNHNYMDNYEFLNKSSYFNLEYLPDEVVGLNFYLINKNNFHWNKTINGEPRSLIHETIIESFDFKFNETREINLINVNRKFYRKHNSNILTTNVNGEKIDFMSWILYGVCQLQFCNYTEIYLKDAFKVDDLLMINNFILNNSFSIENIIENKTLDNTRINVQNINYTLFEIEDINISLEYISLTYLKQFYFMLFEMTSSQLLDEFTLNDASNPIEKLSLTNTEAIEAIENQLNLFPKVKPISLPKVSKYYTLSNDAYVVAKNLMPKLDCYHCLPEKYTYNSYFSVNLKSRFNGKPVCPKKINETEQRLYEINFNNINVVLKLDPYTDFKTSRMDKCDLYENLTYYVNDINYGYTATVVFYLLDAINTPFNLDHSTIINITWEKNYNLFGEPQLIHEKINGVELWGIEFYPLSSNINERGFIYNIKNKVINHNMQGNTDADLLCSYIYDEPILVHTGDDSYFLRNCPGFHPGSPNPRDLIGVANIDIPSSLNFTIESNIKNFAYYISSEESGNLIEYDPRFDDIINYLNTLNNEIEQQEKQIENIYDILEEMNKPDTPSAWDYVSLVFDIFDFADILKAGIKATYSITKNSIKYLRGKADSIKGIIANKISSKLRSSHNQILYNPVEAINNGAIYNYLSGYRLRKFEKDIKLDDISRDLKNIINKDKLTIDAKHLMQSNAAAYSDISGKIFSELEPELLKINYDSYKHPFGHVAVHKSPIEISTGVKAKFLSDAVPKQLTNDFLSNKATKFPFHTSFSSHNLEFNEKDELHLVYRYGGIAEASTVGPTNSPLNIKIGILKNEYKIINNNGKLILEELPWNKIEKMPNKLYTEKDIDELYKSFTSSKTYKQTKSKLSTDEKWELIKRRVQLKYNSREIIDSLPVGNPLYMKALDSLFDYNENYGGFNYNLWSRNCQSFVKSYASLANKGISSISINDKNYKKFLEQFRKNFEHYMASHIEYYDDVFKNFLKPILKYFYN